MVNPIPNPVRTLWDKWNIRGVILTSLWLQIFLILFAPLRKRTDRYPITFSLWSAYLLADCAANFCIGLISDRRDNITTTNAHDYILAFWAPFLLLHLGGPDTITAFALADNELWLRHLLGLFFQLAVTVYVFLLTMPYNNFWIPTVFIFLSGVIKYTERTRSLYRASMNTFRRSMIRDPDAGPNYAKLMEEFASKKEAGIPCSVVVVPEPVETKEADITTKEKLSHVEVVRYAYYYFHKFRGLIVDMIYSTGDRNTTRDFFLSLKAEDAFRVIEVELNFIYEAFFTKDQVLRSRIGYSFRFVSFSCIVAAIVLFTLDPKHAIGRFDVRVSYTLLYGALALDSVALLMLVFSDRTVVRSSDRSQPPDDSAESSQSFKGKLHLILDKVVIHFLCLKEPRWSISKIHPNFNALNTCCLLRRWSGKVSGHNLIEYCHRKSREKSNIVKGICDKLIDKIGVKEELEKCLKKRGPFLWELWAFIFKELKSKSQHARKKEGKIEEKNEEKVEAVWMARGEWAINVALKDVGLEEHKEPLLDYAHPDKVTFDESLLLWHIATSLCYYDEGDPNKGSTNHGGGPNRDNTSHDSGGPNTGMSHDGDRNTSTSKSNHGIWTKLALWCKDVPRRLALRCKGVATKLALRCKGVPEILASWWRGVTKGVPEIPALWRGVTVSEEQDYESDKLRVLSKLLSDYMLYLSVMEPNVMSPVAGIGQLRFQDTCEEAIKFFQKRLEEGEDKAKEVWLRCWPKKDEKEAKEREAYEKACERLINVKTEKKPLEVKGDRSKSLLFDGCMLAKELYGLEMKKRWEVIAKVWVELLSFGASNCKKDAVVQQLSKGGELISFVWLLMVQLGLGTQFQIKEGHARAKLIVGDETEEDTATAKSEGV